MPSTEPQDQAANGAGFEDTEATHPNGDAGVAQTDGDDDFYDDVSEDDARLIELIGFLVQGIVAHPEDVEVDQFFDDVGSIYGVRVHPDDVGRVIGKEGRIANALRQVVKAAATKTGARVSVEIITEDSDLDVADGDDTPDEADGQPADAA